MIVKNRGGQTLVTNAGSNTKFLGVLDFDVRDGRVRDYRYQLMPIFANLLPADREMQSYIDRTGAVGRFDARPHQLHRPRVHGRRRLRHRQGTNASAGARR